MPLATARDGCRDGCRDSAALPSERAVLAAAAGIVVTSEWTRQQVLGRFSICADRVRVARPGADHAEAAVRPSRVPPVDGHLLCVAALATHTGQDILIEALAGLVERDWDCVLVGPLDREPLFAAAAQRRCTLPRWHDTVREVAAALHAAPST